MEMSKEEVRNIIKKGDEQEAYNVIKRGVEAINTRPYATKAEYEKVECIKVLLKAYEKQQKEIEEQAQVIDEMAKELVDLPIPISQEENILFFNSLAVKDFFIKKDKIKGKIEELASNEHIRWANWQKYVHSLCIKNEDGSLTIPKEYVEHWEYEINTEYKDLPENIKESDRKEVRQILELLGE